jgi:hypothetical protein
MKYLKTFENFDLGRFDQEEEECKPCQPEMGEDEEYEINPETEDIVMKGEESLMDEEEEVEEEEVENRIRRWGDEVVEKKKVNAGLQAYLDKKSKGKGKSEEKSSKKAKPDFLDLDKDGDKEETMKKAAKDAKEDKKEDKGSKGLTAAQKKLPEGLRKAIEAKKKK